ncbi:hypothetical protein BT93_F1751 [Corymbia citriodora subsp. variegata]|nr:hypothetical protein BT93_F1751 [Corymbia citriodora subsp. variegata]KAF8024668.1 hypothetical protein BT93_F1751 [Corymbia citriodora subsp. variegata]KAF8024669.1 hypothetical protein BT93_F1751 [Corymbia citriodora subsp. variegata]
MDEGQSQRKRKSAEIESTEGESTPSLISPISTREGSNQYDIFLSFRGSDTRKGFTDHLYHKLINVGTIPIYVFRDDNSIPIGEEFGSLLLDAITRSKISIPIISENFASSKWCLRELIHIMDCKKSTSHIVLPIFYKVKPSDVRYLQGNFGEAFYSRKERFDEKLIQQGQQALSEVSYLNGWESEKFANGHEGALVEKVIETVLGKLRRDFQLDVTKHLVGIVDHVNKIRNWVDASASHARMIGIYGMGGIGKTTLAKFIYNELSNDFKHCSFLSDVRATAHCNGIPHLQNQLIKEIEPTERQVWNIDDGINVIKSRLKGKKVLILLDDIDHLNQLNALARERKWFMTGSLVIVTTRYKAILDQSEFKVDYKYELNGLDEEHSLLLFNRHAFRMDHPLRGYEDISRAITHVLGGLPLALEVLGSSLYGETDEEVWQEVLEKLKKKPPGEVQSKLKISYDALEDEQKEIFLDIACFSIGKEIKFTIYMWKDCGFYPSLGIKELKLRCLIKIGDDGKLMMHDQLRDLGRSIVQQEGPLERRSRLWAYEEAFGVIMGKEGTEKIQGISLDEHDERPWYLRQLHTFTNEQFKNLQSLRILKLGRATLIGDFNEIFSKLRWLEWFGIVNDLSFSAMNLHLPKLVVVQISQNMVTEDWQGWSSIMVARRLKILDLTSCYGLRCTPNLSAFTELEILKLRGCSELKQVHSSIGKVKSLISLDLSHCTNLKELPEEVGELEKLKDLILDHAGIVKIPTSIGSMRKLEKLTASVCQSLREIPSSIGNLSSLRHLNLKGCGLLREIPSSIGGLQYLQDLDFSHSEIEKLPNSIGRLKKLQKLSLLSCCSFKGAIPNEIGDLSLLENLEISNAPISDLPESIRNLPSLQHLKLWNCEILSLPELPSSLKCLIVSCQTPRLPQLSYLMHLEVLFFGGGGLLQCLPELPSSLLKLRVIFCKLIVVNIDGLKHLEELSIEFCNSIERLDIAQLNRLKLLHVEGCGNLVEIRVHDNLESLETIAIRECKAIQRLILQELQSLKKLGAKCCDNLVEIRGLDRAQILEALQITRCGSIIKLPDLSRCEKLQTLVVQDCNKLKQLQGLEKLDLTYLDIFGCDSLETLPELPGTQVFRNYERV